VAAYSCRETFDFKSGHGFCDITGHRRLAGKCCCLHGGNRTHALQHSLYEVRLALARDFAGASRHHGSGDYVVRAKAEIHRAPAVYDRGTSSVGRRFVVALSGIGDAAFTEATKYCASLRQAPH
jgi:hypothetical protein